jgi:hypothetical protein
MNRSVQEASLLSLDKVQTPLPCPSTTNLEGDVLLCSQLYFTYITIQRKGKGETAFTSL